jgi:hypothetical protein
MKKLLQLSAGIVALALSQISLGATSSWTQTSLAPSVYGPSTENSNFFSTPVNIPLGATITTVYWSIGLYTNGATRQSYQVCYAPRYSSDYSKCTVAFPSGITTSDFFNGLVAKGHFKITGILFGGSYPVYPTHNNSITAHYRNP